MWRKAVSIAVIVVLTGYIGVALRFYTETKAATKAAEEVVNNAFQRQTALQEELVLLQGRHRELLDAHENALKEELELRNSIAKLSKTMRKYSRAIETLREKVQTSRTRADNLKDEVSVLELEKDKLEAELAAAEKPVAPIPGNGGKITLTFDDSGTATRVNAILDVLKRYNVRSTMFVTGSWAASQPSLIQRMRDEGHVVANHTWSHANLTQLSDTRVREEILHGDQGNDLFRPPYGALNDRVRSIISDLGYRIVLWNIDTRDWAGVSKDHIVNTVLSQARPGAIVLMHFHGANTLDALPDIITGLRNSGYVVGI